MPDCTFELNIPYAFCVSEKGLLLRWYNNFQLISSDVLIHINM